MSNIYLTPEQIEIIASRGKEPSIYGRYDDAYMLIADMLPESDVKRWFIGAAQANAGKGIFSEIIRAYSIRQMELRGVDIEPGIVQTASNAVAVAALNDVLNENLRKLPDGRWLFPTLSDISIYDATAVGKTLFSSLYDDSAGGEYNAAWSGAILFSGLGLNESGRLSKTGVSADADTLDDIKNILFAYEAYGRAWDSALGKFGDEIIDFATDFDLQIIRDIGIGIEVLDEGLDVSWALSSGNISTLLSGEAKKFGLLIERHGPSLALDMVIGALTGESSIGATTNANFAERSRAFFAGMTPAVIQAISARISSSPDELKGLARSDVRARAALSANSLIFLDVAPSDANRLSLYDSVTGEGEVTEEWIVDRASMLAAILENGTNETPVRNLGEGTIYKDLSSNVVAGFSGSDEFIETPDLHITFGSDTDDTVGSSGDRDRIYGGLGNDTITGSEGRDTLFGGSGNDELEGGDEADTLIGAGGSDTLDGGSDADLLDGGAGDDTLKSTADKANDTLRGGAGVDIYEFVGSFGVDTIQDAGGEGSVMINGQPISRLIAIDGLPDVFEDETHAFRAVRLTNGDGSQTLQLMALSEGAGTVVIESFVSGNLGITLENGEEEPAPTSQVFGEFEKALNDNGVTYKKTSAGYLSAGALADTEDFLLGTASEDLIDGGGGNDAMTGFGGADILDGGDGDDLILGGLGQDTIYGGDGADHLLGSGDGVLELPDDLDEAQRPALGEEISRGFGWVVYENPSDGDVSNRTVSSAMYPGTLTGDDGNRIYGGAGDDWIYAGTGRDVAYGDDDDDFIWGMDAGDTLFGGAGNDRIRGDGSADVELISYTDFAAHGGDFIDGGSGDDTLDGEGGSDTIYGGAGNDSILGDGDLLEGVPTYTHGNDVLDGGEGNDTIGGGGGDDDISGGAGNDLLVGDNGVELVLASAHGSDTLKGGDGSDELFGNGGADFLYGEEGDDTLFGDSGDLEEDDQLADYVDGGQGNDSLMGQGGNDTLVGGTENDTLGGGKGNDFLDGGEHDDYLDGGEGDDIVSGGSGFNVLMGGEGNDTLVGGGKDYLNGGAGDDVYQISFKSGNAVTIADSDGTSVLAGLDASQLQVVSQEGNLLVAVKGTGAAIALESESQLDSIVVNDASSNSQISLRALVDLAGAIPTVMWDDTSGPVASSSATVSQKQIGGGYRDLMSGGTAADTLLGGGGDDELRGGDGDDWIEGGAGLDLIVGGKGNDHLLGNGSGSYETGDIFFFDRGDGFDTVKASWSGGVLSVLRFGAGVGPDDISLFNVGSSSNRVLAIDYGDGDRIILENGSEQNISRLEFADGAILSMIELIAGLPASDGGDPTFVYPVAGGDANDTLVGSALMERLLGYDGDDLLEGGGGMDILVGGPGTNTYRFVSGFGNDTIEPTVGEIGMLQFDLSASETLSASFDGDDLVLASLTGDSVRIAGYQSQSGALANWQVQVGTDDAVPFPEFLEQALSNSADSLLARKRAFISMQYSELHLLPQRVPEYGLGYSWDPYDGRQGIRPVEVLHEDIQVADGLPLNLGSFLQLVTESVDRVVHHHDPVYETVPSTGSSSLGASGGFKMIFVPIDVSSDSSGSTGGSTNGESVYTFSDANGNTYWGIIEPIETVYSSTSSSATRKLVGWNDWDEVVTEFVYQDIVTQRSVLGSGGNDTIVSAAVDAEGYPAMFRGSIDAGGGDDVVRLAAGAVGNWSDWTWGEQEAQELTRTDDWMPIGYGNTIGNIHYDHGMGAWVDAGSGDDTVQGTGGDDFIIGGRGNDVLDGQAGADTYLIGAHSGEVDYIADWAEVDWALEDPFGLAYAGFVGGDQWSRIRQPNLDTVEFDETVNLDSLRYRWIQRGEHSGRSSLVTLELVLDNQPFLRVDYASEAAMGLISHRLTEAQLSNLSGWFSADWLDDDRVVSMPGVERFRFSDGTELALHDMLAGLQIYDGNIAGTNGADQLTGWRGNDRVLGMGGDDTLAGGDGDDYLEGGDGNDELIGDDSAVSEIDVRALTVFAKGRAALDEAPLMEVRIGDVLIATVAVEATEFVAYEFELPSAIAARDVSVTFTNDFYAPDQGLDRNLWVEKVVVNGVELTGQSVGSRLDHGREDQAFDGLNRYRGGGNLYSNGSLIFGLTGNDLLDGGAGADTMRGGVGNDIYVIDSASDVVIEEADQGLDLVNAYATYTLTDHVEDLYLKGADNIEGTGNDLVNNIHGNEGSNRIDGQGGADFMRGGLGDDTYVVDNAGDVTWETADQGYDKVESSVSYRLKNHVEQLELLGSADLVGAGNIADNVILGNAGMNQLSGDAGNDLLVGDPTDSATVELDSLTIFAKGRTAVGIAPQMQVWAGDTLLDTLYVNASDYAPYEVSIASPVTASDVRLTFTNDYYDPAAGLDRNLNIEKIVVNGAEIRNDSFGSRVDFGQNGHAADGFRRYRGWGNLYSNGSLIFGLVGADLLNGGTGDDTMRGGIGNDIYVVDSALDVVTELADQGLDQVDAHTSYTLTDHVEDLYLKGVENIDGTGNALMNNIHGNEGDNRIDGRGGADFMDGGLGDDTYVVDNSGDIAWERADEGYDIVESSISHTLRDHVEELQLTGGLSINGTGNNADNVLSGNDANNALRGSGGNDTISGGLGDDSYRFDRGDGVDHVIELDTAPGGYDRLVFGEAIGADQIWFNQSGDDLVVSVIGTTDKIIVDGWYVGGLQRIERIETVDGSALVASQVENLVSAMAAFAPPAAGEMTLPDDYRNALSGVIAANWS